LQEWQTSSKFLQTSFKIDAINMNFNDFESYGEFECLASLTSFCDDDHIRATPNLLVAS